MTELLNIARGPLDSDEGFSLAVVRSAGGVILGRKTRGFGNGRLVLPGGKSRYYLDAGGVGLAPGSVDVSREVCEETGLDLEPRLFTQVGLLNIDPEDGEPKSIAVYTAYCRPVPLRGSSELSELDWYEEQELPYEEMPDDYRLWLPHVLAGYAVTAFLDTYGETLLSSTAYRQQLEPLGRMEVVPQAAVTR